MPIKTQISVIKLSSILVVAIGVIIVLLCHYNQIQDYDYSDGYIYSNDNGYIYDIYFEDSKYPSVANAYVVRKLSQTIECRDVPLVTIITKPFKRTPDIVNAVIKKIESGDMIFVPAPHGGDGYDMGACLIMDNKDKLIREDKMDTATIIFSTLYDSLQERNFIDEETQIMLDGFSSTEIDRFMSIVREKYPQIRLYKMMNYDRISQIANSHIRSHVISNFRKEPAIIIELHDFDNSGYGHYYHRNWDINRENNIFIRYPIQPSAELSMN